MNGGKPFIFYAVVVKDTLEILSLHRYRSEARDEIAMNDDPGEERELKVRRARGALFEK